MCNSGIRKLVFGLSVPFCLALSGCPERGCDAPFAPAVDDEILTFHYNYDGADSEEIEIDGCRINFAVTRGDFAASGSGVGFESAAGDVEGTTCVKIEEVTVRLRHDANRIEEIEVRNAGVATPAHSETHRLLYPGGGADPNCASPTDLSDIAVESGNNTVFFATVPFVEIGEAGHVLFGNWKIDITDRLGGGACGDADTVAWGTGMTCSDISDDVADLNEIRGQIRFRVSR